MCLWRVMSRGAKRYCPDVFGGAVYVEGELEPEYPRPPPRAPEPATTPRVDEQTSEIRLPPPAALPPAAKPPPAPDADALACTSCAAALTRRQYQVSPRA